MIVTFNNYLFNQMLCEYNFGLNRKIIDDETRDKLEYVVNSH